MFYDYILVPNTHNVNDKYFKKIDFFYCVSYN